MSASASVSNNTGALRLATDIGGTFTDVASFEPSSGRLRFGKTLTTPRALVEGIEILDAFEKEERDGEGDDSSVHGVTPTGKA